MCERRGWVENVSSTFTYSLVSWVRIRQCERPCEFESLRSRALSIRLDLSSVRADKRSCEIERPSLLSAFFPITFRQMARKHANFANSMIDSSPLVPKRGSTYKMSQEVSTFSLWFMYVSSQPWMNWPAHFFNLTSFLGFIKWWASTKKLPVCSSLNVWLLSSFWIFRWLCYRISRISSSFLFNIAMWFREPNMFHTCFEIANTAVMVDGVDVFFF